MGLKDLAEKESRNIEGKMEDGSGGGRRRYAAEVQHTLTEAGLRGPKVEPKLGSVSCGSVVPKT
jgi:hypothetical protein